MALNFEEPLEDGHVPGLLKAKISVLIARVLKYEVIHREERYLGYAPKANRNTIEYACAFECKTVFIYL